MIHTMRRSRARDLFARRPGALLASLCLLFGLLASACEDDLASGPSGQSITGRVFYTGAAAADMARPAVQVYAFATFPPQGPPHASTTIPDPDLVNGAQYELEFLEPGAYYVLAELNDLDNADAAGVPGGAYPDFCALGNTTGNVPITATQGQVGINVTLYGAGGAEDPCNVPNTDICPEDGAATLSLVVDASLTPADIGPDDNVTYALFDSWPVQGAPSRFQLITAENIEFPLTIVDNNVPAREQVVYVCLDRGGDNVGGLCGEEDLLALHDEGALVDFAAGTITNITLTLETAAGAIAGVENAVDRGCDVGEPDPDGVGEIQVHVASADLTPGAGDTLSVTLFGEFPPAAPPAFFTVVDPLETFPLDVSVTDVDAGAHYLSVCYDAGGDSRSCDGEGDTLVWYADGAGTVTVRDEETLHIFVSMEGESLAANTIQVVVDSATLTPSEGDSVSVSAFTAFPPAGPPSAAASEALAAFPAVLSLTSVGPGDYYVAACYDAGGDNTSCDGEGDVLVFYGGGLSAVEMTTGSSYSLGVSLDPQM